MQKALPVRQSKAAGIPAVADAIATLFSEDAVVTRSFQDEDGKCRVHEIGGTCYRFGSDGTVLDAFAYSNPRTAFDQRKRTEVDHATLRVKPVTVGYRVVPALTFMSKSGSDYTQCLLAGGSIAYAVDLYGCEIGMVAKARFTPEEAGDHPRVQWLAMGRDGKVWFSYGRTREEAARHLVREVVETTLANALPLAIDTPLAA